jgi:uncharacterized protein YbaA (DUF1428 family)
MKLSRVRVLLFLITMMCGTSARIAWSADEVPYIQMHMTKMSQPSQQGESFQGSQIVHPSPRERDAISQVLTTKPRPKTLTNADIKLLKELLNKPTWFGFEQRIVHDIWAEISGKEWRHTEEATFPRNNKLP